MHPLWRSLKCCAFLQIIAPPALFHLFSQQTACGNRYFAPAARRDSMKIQPKGSRRGKKRCGKALQSPFLFCLFVQSSPQRLIKATYPHRAQGTKEL
jgi:hypothetical protein